MAKNRGIRRHTGGRGKKDNWFIRMKMWQRVLLCGAAGLACCVGVAAAFIAMKWKKIDTHDIQADDLIINQEVIKRNEDIDLGSGHTNIALFGVDSRDGNLGKGNRTDCIIIASLNNETKEIRMVSVYRDTLLDLSDGSYQKCNAAYSYGGPVMAINMLNMNLDLDIQDYVTVDFGAIADAIDLLGGVEIDVTAEEVQYVNEHLQGTANSAGTEAHFLTTPGLQLLDGTQATTYARIRSTAGGDITRTQRQRLVIEKMFDRAIKTDLATLNSIIDKVFPQISTSFTLKEILNYALAYKEYSLGESLGFPVDYSMDTLYQVGSVIIPQDLRSNVVKLHEFMYGVTEYTPSSAVASLSSAIASMTSSSPSVQTSDGSSGQKASTSSGGGNSTWSGSGNAGGTTGGTTGNYGSGGSSGTATTEPSGDVEEPSGGGTTDGGTGEGGTSGGETVSPGPDNSGGTGEGGDSGGGFSPVFPWPDNGGGSDTPVEPTPDSQ